MATTGYSNKLTRPQSATCRISPVWLRDGVEQIKVHLSLVTSLAITIR
jgi:hypothetical protein